MALSPEAADLIEVQRQNAMLWHWIEGLIISGLGGLQLAVTYYVHSQEKARKADKDSNDKALLEAKLVLEKALIEAKSVADKAMVEAQVQAGKALIEAKATADKDLLAVKTNIDSRMATVWKRFDETVAEDKRLREAHVAEANTRWEKIHTDFVTKSELDGHLVRFEKKIDALAADIKELLKPKKVDEA